MKAHEIDLLMYKGSFPNDEIPRQLIETHISWVIICNYYTYKIKKSIVCSFLDFSSVEKRYLYCKREIELNQRIAGNMYIDVMSVVENSGVFSIGRECGSKIDYAVRMRTMDTDKQMNVLLEKNMVTCGHIIALARKIAGFHQQTHVIYSPNRINIQQKFSELANEVNFLKSYIDIDTLNIIAESVHFFGAFIRRCHQFLYGRLKAGFYRDCHGDLHTRNIFLLPEPLPFDCIEFNDEYREIDVLNEVAFLCMDLDFFGRQDLSDLFLREYNTNFPMMTSPQDRQLFSVLQKLSRQHPGQSKQSKAKERNVKRSSRRVHCRCREILAVDEVLSGGTKN
jgi:hypothetical protein